MHQPVACSHSKHPRRPHLPNLSHHSLPAVQVFVRQARWAGYSTGDAAHAMPPHRGQGLKNALQDAVSLVEELAVAKKGEKSLQDAVKPYEADMRQRTLAEILLSIMQAQMVHSLEKLMNAPMIKSRMNALKQQQEQEKEAEGMQPAT